MYPLLFFFLIIQSLAYSLDNKSDGTKWAVLVAGSNGYWNYRHQADVCHAYQIFHENGYPDSNIVVMMYDDIAYNDENPFPGVILNKPGGNNLYTNVPKDYTGVDVTPENFLSVLRGDNSTGKKFLNSGPNDEIFIYFTDHGAAGLIAFPNDELYAHDLIKTLEYMYSENKYRTLVFYLEACESGSMFNQLLRPDINVYAVTAANPSESSYACCFDSNVNAYLGDEFSVNWLYNSDSFENIVNETLNNQFKKVRHDTKLSHVCIYGNKSMSHEKLSRYLTYNGTFMGKQDKVDSICESHLIDTREVKIDFLIRQLVNLNIKNKYISELKRELYQEYILQMMYGNIEKKNKTNDPLQCYPKEYIDTCCLQNKVNSFKRKYGPLTESSFKYLRSMGAECIS